MLYRMFEVQMNICLKTGGRGMHKKFNFLDYVYEVFKLQNPRNFFSRRKQNKALFLAVIIAEKKVLQV